MDLIKKVLVFAKEVIVWKKKITSSACSSFRFLCNELVDDVCAFLQQLKKTFILKDCTLYEG